MFENMFEKALKIGKRLTIVYSQYKMVDKDAICLINVMSVVVSNIRRSRRKLQNFRKL